MHRTRKDIHIISILLLTAFAVIAYLLPLDGREMLRPDEFRYAEIPREMLVSGTWLSPRLNGVRYYEKPTLGYQLTAASMKCFGENAFALRLPSALATLLTAAMLYWLCRKCSRDPWLPGAATAIFLTFGIIVGIGTYGVLDAQFSTPLTVCIGAFLLACRSRDAREKTLLLILTGAAAGVAFMTKGFLAFAIPAAALVPFLCWERDWKKLFTLPWIPLAAVLAVALPWAWQLHRTEPDFWRYFFVEEHWMRFTSGTYDRKAQPFWYFIPILFAGMLPSGALWAAAWAGVGKKWLRDSFTRAMICWFAGPFLLLSASSCKLGTYILPCFVPLAILTALALRRAMVLKSRLCRRIVGMLSGIFGWGFIAVAISTALALIVAPHIEKLPCLTTRLRIVPSLASMLLLGAVLLQCRRRNVTLQIGALLLGTAPVICFGMCSIPDELFGSRASAVGLRQCFEHIPVDAECVVAVERTCIAPVCWVLKRNDLVVVGRMGEMTYGFTRYPDEYGTRYSTDDAFPKLVKSTAPGKMIYITFKDLKKSPLPREWPTPRERHTASGVTAIRF